MLTPQPHCPNKSKQKQNKTNADFNYLRGDKTSPDGLAADKALAQAIYFIIVASLLCSARVPECDC